MLRGCFIAVATACLVIALNTTRSTACDFLSACFSRSTSSTCQEIASPSRSGSVARISVLAALTALAISASRLAAFGSTCHTIWKSNSGSTEPSLAGRSRTWPKEASTSYPGPKYLWMVLALAGDSTTTTFMNAQSSACRSPWLLARVRTGTWVSEPCVSNPLCPSGPSVLHK